ncbi:MAG: hypothetical protein IJ605_04900 [Prevotella sp.]|nr:hypothetical protein [Prevotella sp.]
MKKNVLSRILLTMVSLLSISCGSDEAGQANAQNFQTSTEMTKMYLTIGGQTQSVTLADNQATKELVAKLKENPVTVTLNSSGGFEIWGSLGFSLTTSNEQINGQPGDVVLYNGSNICLFYGSNSWTYTRLGKIDGLSASELRTFLKAGENNIAVTLSLTADASGIEKVEAENTAKSESREYTLTGSLAAVNHKGIVIKGGKKYKK